MATAHDFRKGMHFDHKSAVMLANEFFDYLSVHEGG
jgi:SAM-dependent MidA family methyltransferase